MAEKTVPLTKEGKVNLEEELKELTINGRQAIAEKIHNAKELSSTQNNAEYDEAKNEQARIEGRILEIQNVLAHAVVIDEDGAHKNSKITVGADVTVVDEDGKERKYTIVGPPETDPAKGRISNESPVGQALLGRQVGDEIQVAVPAGLKKYRIKKIS
ncbi:MAG TPA: transcription elongation factor GreA [Dehalococcoidia bacterium]|nr:transcription elongation factor GreA [Dehalococcoidia bacterium]